MLTNTDLYQTDFAAWCAQTAVLLRTGQWSELDVEALAEEVESLARSQRRELANRLEVLVKHLLKWDCQPARRVPSTWESTIHEQRRALGRLLTEIPSLRPEVAGVLADIYPAARQDAIKEMTSNEARRNQRYRRPFSSSLTMRVASFHQFQIPPEVCPWSAEAVLNPDYWPGVPSDAP